MRVSWVTTSCHRSSGSTSCECSPRRFVFVRIIFNWTKWRYGGSRFRILIIHSSNTIDSTHQDLAPPTCPWPSSARRRVLRRKNPPHETAWRETHASPKIEAKMRGIVNARLSNFRVPVMLFMKLMSNSLNPISKVAEFNSSTYCVENSIRLHSPYHTHASGRVRSAAGTS